MPKPIQNSIKPIFRFIITSAFQNINAYYISMLRTLSLDELNQVAVTGGFDVLHYGIDIGIFVFSGEFIDDVRHDV